ncbi:MAG: class B sortase [Clostridia bacterium]|nr:class B sortase [Clostridia bacterium]
MKKRRKRKPRRWSLLLSLIVFFGCAFALGQYYLEGRETQSDVNRLLELLEESPATQDEAQEKMSEPADEASNVNESRVELQTAEGTGTVLTKYQALYELNSDLAGWVSIEGTNINYPVMYTPDEPEYYLHRSFDGKKRTSGLPFLDSDCSLFPRSMNLVVYGHHMRDGSMFADLMEYESEEFCRQHGLIQFDTIYEAGKYAVVGAFTVSVSKNSEDALRYYYQLIDPTEDEFNEFMRALRENRLYDLDVDAEYGDQLLMLSTCEYSHAEGRMVVVAKKVE